MNIQEHILRGGPIKDANPDYGYIPGFGNTHSTQAEEGALPIGRNSPQRHPLGLYAEQLSGTAFTAPRASNKRSWLYRILPSVRHGTGYQEVETGAIRTAPARESSLPSMQLRWQPVPLPEEGKIDFLSGLATMTTCGDAAMQAGMASHVYSINASMGKKCFQNSDGEMLMIPQRSKLKFVTEFGIIIAEPGEIVIIPKGVRFRVDLIDGPARGFVCENYGMQLTLPERGPIGANCLANARDFLYPVAAYEDCEREHELFCKTNGRIYRTKLDHSPLDVVAWHGNYAPCKYDLRRFAPVGAILFDHPDPSIFTVLTSASETPGTANVDFVIFPDRWLVMEDSFRPPWYHMNVMSEFMGLIYGVYDAKPGGFVPGGMSLHNALVPHGPDSEAFEKASNKVLEPEKLAGTMAFMFETRYPQDPTTFASNLSFVDTRYPDCWRDLKRMFKSNST
ncbi:MAG: homogentisate 1,2-dioxygenase [Albidovulum sp.]|nr:homogentisate 1,2-dioxygenase [Albidovulum sp.]MDE0306416.1 homogentisate 1,2-dioxygenase [Albidovulum sp.]MDE0532228.1 homogentisate 1,2-dioxygenase [Albidovulum sp.]